MKKSKLIKRINKEQNKTILQIVEEDILTRNKYQKPLISKSLLLLSFLVVVVISILIIPKTQVHSELYQYVFVDINPSIEFIVNEDDIVTNTRALNIEGALVVYGEELNGKKIADAIKSIIDISNDLEYFNNQEIKILSISNKQEKEDALQTSLTLEIKNYLLTQSINASINPTIDLDLINQAIENKISLGKLKLINECMMGDSTVSFDELLLKSVPEIKNLLTGYNEEEITNYNEDIASSILDSRQTLNQAALNALNVIIMAINRYQEKPKNQDLINIQRKIDAYNETYNIKIIKTTQTMEDLKIEIEMMINNYQIGIIDIKKIIKDK